MKRKRSKKINGLLSLVIVVVLLPMMITMTFQRMKLEKLLLRASGESAVESESKLPAMGETESDFAERSLEAESRVLGIVAKEISASENAEAILAQSVIARTNLYAAWENGTQEPQGLSLSQMQSLWGEDFGEIYRKFTKEVAQTKGQVLCWEGKYIYAPYHALSAGATRNVSELYTDADMPYLQTVACPKDTTAEGYVGVFYWEESEFLKKCEGVLADIAVSSAEAVVVESRDAAEYVLRIKIGEKTVDGEIFRSAFSLNSACFSIDKIGDNVRIVTKGIGHGVGLSQYTAAQMAEEGKDYRGILEYFYPGARLETIK